MRVHRPVSLTSPYFYYFPLLVATGRARTRTGMTETFLKFSARTLDEIYEASIVTQTASVKGRGQRTSLKIICLDPGISVCGSPVYKICAILLQHLTYLTARR